MKINFCTVVYQLYITPYVKITHNRFLNGNYELIVGWFNIEMVISIYQYKKIKIMRVKSKFDIKDTRTFSEKAKSFFQSTMFWRGRKKGMIHTRNIKFKDIRAVFFPMNFYEKYHYLGSIPHHENGKLFKAILPIILTMDYEAKPKWCPRWFLRLLYLFGNDNSIIRVRNRTLHNLQVKLTKGIMLIDWKTKWNDYDLRISAYAPEYINELTNAIQSSFHSRGRQEELVEQIRAIDPEASIMWGSISRLEKQLEELEDTTT